MALLKSSLAHQRHQILLVWVRSSCDILTATDANFGSEQLAKNSSLQFELKMPSNTCVSETKVPAVMLCPVYRLLGFPTEFNTKISLSSWPASQTERFYWVSHRWWNYSNIIVNIIFNKGRESSAARIPVALGNMFKSFVAKIKGSMNLTQQPLLFPINYKPVYLSHLDF